MRHIITSLLLCLCTISIQGQRLTHDFKNTSLSEALIWIDRAQQDYHLNFIYDELEDFTVTTRLERLTADNAVRQVIGFYPMRMTIDGRNIYVECLQKEEHKFCGQILDEQGHPLEFATISLLSAGDSCFINGGVSNENGDFVIPCKPQQLTVRVTYVGYKTQVMTCHSSSHPIIRLKPEALTINGVVVQGEMPKAQLRGSSLIMNVENTVMAHMGTAEEVLTRVPMIVRRGEGYEIMGKGAPLIYLNGRKLTDLSELKNVQADNIRNVEVIQNPGARYDATVNAVIIIHTKRPAGEGLGVELTSWSRRAHGYANNERLNLTYRTGGLELFANLFGAYNRNWSRSEFQQKVYADTLWVITNNNHETTRNPFLEGRFGFNYQIGDQHSFGGFYQHTHDYVKATEESDDDLTANGAPYDHLHNSSISRAEELPRHQINLYYNGTVGLLNIDFNADYTFRKRRNRNTQQELSTEYDDRDVNTLSLTRSQMLAEKLVVSHPLWKGDIEVGEEYTYTRWRSAFENAEGYIANSNNEQHERNIAPFMELRQQWGRLRLTAGLRYEHVESDYFVGGVRRNEQCRTYNDLFPSFSASTALKDVQLSLSYAKRTNRPAYWQLSSDVIYANRLNVQTGNPYLKPVKYHNWSLMAMWRGLYLSLNYSHCIDPILYTAESAPRDSKVNLVTYKNYNHAEWLTATLGFQKTVTLGANASWMPQWNVMLMKPWFKAAFLGEQKRFNHPMLALQLGNMVSLPHDWLLRADFNMHTRGYQQNVWFNCINPMLTLSLSKDLFAQRLNVRLEARDVFNGGINRFALYSNRLQIGKQEDNDSRAICLSLRYRFNITRSKYKGTGAGHAELGRL